MDRHATIAVIGRTNRHHKPVVRFQGRTTEENLRSPDTIYLLNLDLIANEEDAVFRTKDLMYLSRGDGEPTELLIQPPEFGGFGTPGVSFGDVQEVVSENRRRVLEAARYPAVKSPSLRHLIEEVGPARDRSAFQIP